MKRTHDADGMPSRPHHKCSECEPPKLKAESVALQMLKEANKFYPDGCIEGYFDLQTGKELKKPVTFDTLALFIGREILSVVDEEMTEEDARMRVDAALTNAAQELDRIIAHFRGTLEAL